MAYKVGMLDMDCAYQKAFMEYLNLRSTIPLRLYIFSNMERLENFCHQNELDLLLVGDEIEECGLNVPVLILTKHREHAQTDRYLFRYQSMEVIVQCILDTISKQRPKVEHEHAFLAVYSPLGRCGKTIYAKKLCNQFTKSLYVNWEGISSEPPADGFGSWMIYCMKSRNEECMEYLKEKKITSISSPDSFQDICQVEKSDLVWFRDAVRRRSMYDAVVFDIGSTVVCGYSVLEVFDRVYIPTLDDAVSQKKMQEFDRMVRQEIIDVSGLHYVQE